MGEPRRTARAFAVCAGIMLPAITGSAESTAPTESPAEPVAQPTLSEIVVSAPEPRFVAPTLRDRIGRIWAPVLINGRGPFRLVLDTGASHSALIPSTAERLGASGLADGHVLLHGVTGAATVGAIRVNEMEVGELLLSSTRLPIVPDVFGGAEGVLGREGLSDKRILADFRHDRLVITRSHRESAPTGYTTVPLKLTHAGLLVADIKIGSMPAEAIIDTGAQVTIGNLALRDALMRHPPRDARVDEIIGVTLDVQHGDDIPAPVIAVGDLRIRNIHVTFGDMFLFEHWKMLRQPTMLLGMDVLGTFDVLIIDYKRRELQLLLRNRHADS